MVQNTKSEDTARFGNSFELLLEIRKTMLIAVRIS